LAQQIKQVIPEAVTYQTDFIPNIYSYAYLDEPNIVKLSEEFSAITSIPLNAKIKLLTPDTEHICNVVSIDPTNNSITIDKQILSQSKVFVYGTEVTDFNTLNKSYIYTLNVCATQSLADKLKGLKSKLAEIKSKL
jgi:hypothetical protein